MLRSIFVAVIVATLTSSSNANDEQAIEFFERDIRPLLAEHCYACHAADQSKGGLRLDSSEAMRRGGDSGPVFEPSDSDASLLIRAVRYNDRNLQMPPKNRLANAEIAALEKWISMGAPDPRTESKATSLSPTGMSIEEGRRFWSFRPVSNPKVPMTEGNRVRSPIDAFVFARLEQAGLTPAPPADKLTLIRRVTQNLTGLPPTTEEIDAFIEDDSPDAFDRVVERLLQSPGYGVRWGRHWLDVARYADSNGLDENLGFGQAWRYRDYVVNSFNNDKPYNEFIIEQLAGDLLPGVNRETKTATGFLALGAKVLAEPDRRKLEMDIIDEQLDALGKAFLGMTFGCVRCHDHKFDPVTQRDYYALAAIFKSTRTLGDTNTGAIKHWYEHSFANEVETQQLEEIETQIKAKQREAATFKNEQTAKIRGEARRQAATYLSAASRLDVDASLTEVAAIAEPLGLHPRILHHCRLHLDYHRNDPVFAAWHRLNSASAIEEHYQTLFSSVETALAEAKPPPKKLSDPKLQAARVALEDRSGFLAVPPKPEFAFDAATLERYYELMEAARRFESAAQDETAAMGVADGEVNLELPIHIRGSYKNLGAPVKREFPEVMRSSLVRPIFPAGRSGRLELARWIADTRHPLTARVIVNRIWGWHFGAPLVKTTENFGKLGDRPSHPLLLDWLAHRFMQNGWSIKELHRDILRSAAYQLDSWHPDSHRYEEVDPENRLLWRANIRRLEAESIRDTVLAVSGRLDQTLGGKTLPLRNRQFVFNHTSEDHTRYDSVRRAIYLPVIRNHLYVFFEQYDFPDPTMPAGSRSSTVIAPQTLVMMNDPFIIESAGAFADRLSSLADEEEDRLVEAYRLAYGREPSTMEAARGARFLESTHDVADQRAAWTLFCQSLLASNEFIYLR